MPIVTLLALVLVVCVLVYVTRLLVADVTVQRVLIALVVLVALLWILKSFGVLGNLSHSFELPRGTG